MSVFMTRIDVKAGGLLVDVEVLERRPPPITDEQAERLRARVQDALEPVLAEFWPGQSGELDEINGRLA